MLIDFNQKKLEQFDQVAQLIVAHPQDYVSIDSIADFYQLECLSLFPEGTQWCCSGLDDGAESFDAVIYYKNRRMNISYGDQLVVKFEKMLTGD